MGEEGKYSAYMRLLRYSKPYWRRVAVAMVASLIVAGTDVSAVKLVEPLIDKILIASNSHLLKLVPFFVVGLFTLKGVARFFQEYLIKTAGQLTVQDIRNDYYEHSLSLSMGYFSRETAGNLMSRVLNDVGTLQRSAADVLADVVREGVTLVGLTCLAFYQDWRLSCLAFLVLPAAVLPASIIGRRIKQNTRSGQARLGNLTSVLQETYSGIKVIKAFGKEHAEGERFRRENSSFYRFMRKVLKYDSAAAPVVEILASFGLAAVLWYGATRVLEGSMTQGELLSIVAAIGLMYTPVKRLTKASNTIQKALGSAERVFEIMDEVPDIADAVNPLDLGRSKGTVVFDQVNFAYDDEMVLSNFSLNAQSGEIVALVGASGAGKSTVAGLLARFYDPQQGGVFIDGVDIREVSLASLKNNLGFVDQETFLFNESIRNNIRYARPEATDAEVEAAAEKAFADEFIRQLPEAYETSIGDRGIRLSGGQRQRICIARALLKDAPILILDEATSALDTESESMVQKALANLMKNRTTLVIAHRLSTIMNADRIMVLEQGRVVESGAHQELLQNGGLYRRLYDLQFRDPDAG